MFLLGKMAKFNVKEKFFRFDEGSQLFKCLVEGCRSMLKGADSSLKRHVVQQHPAVAKQIGLDGYKRPMNTEVGQSEGPSVKRMKTISVQVDPDNFFCGLVKMSAVHSLPFNFFDSEAFHETTGIMSKALGISSNSKAMVSSITDVANKIRELITTAIQSRMVCFKYDGASRHNRKIFGINVQYLENGQFIIRTLSMLEMKERQTGENLKKHIENVLKSYDLNLLNVYSATTDNGQNMLKCSSNLRVEQDKSLMLLSDDDDVSFEKEVESVEKPETEDESDEAESNMEVMLRDLEESFVKSSDGCIEKIKCGAHTLNLVAKDVLDNESEAFLKVVRKLVKAARKMEFRTFFDIVKIPLPRIDCETRWGSTKIMIDSILSHEGFYRDVGKQCAELMLSDETWSFMKEYREAFEPLFSATKAFQQENFTFGDAFKAFKKCQFDMKMKVNGQNRFATPIVDALNSRMKEMFNNRAFKAALIFDQRWCFVDSPFFSKEDKLSAIVSIIDIIDKQA